MNQNVERLQELLARVRRNAALPRTLVSASVPEPTADVYDRDSAPAYNVPDAEFTVEEVFFESQPPAEPEFTSQPAAQASATLDASVDELLLEDPFPSVPPGPSYSEVLEGAMQRSFGRDTVAIKLMRDDQKVRFLMAGRSGADKAGSWLAQGVPWGDVLSRLATRGAS